MKAASDNLYNILFEMDPSDLFDVRKDFAHEKEYIPGAVNLPHSDMNSVSTAPG